MSKVRIYGDTSGYVDIAVPAVAGTTTLNLDKIPQADITTGNIAMDTDTLFVDAQNNRVGIGTSNPGSDLHVKGTMEIEGDASYFADTLASVNSTAIALNIAPTRASVTKSIAMGAIGSTNTGTVERTRP